MNRWLFSLPVVLGLLLASGLPTEACHKRATACCYPDYPPVWPCGHGHCWVYRVSEPVENVNGPFHTLVRGATVGHGVIVQFDVPSGAPPFPTDTIQVIQSGAGQMRYAGWNKQVVNPGLPGSPTRYSIFLCPVKAGDCLVEVGLAYSNNTMKSVPYKFDIK